MPVEFGLDLDKIRKREKGINVSKVENQTDRKVKVVKFLCFSAWGVHIILVFELILENYVVLLCINIITYLRKCGILHILLH